MSLQGKSGRSYTLGGLVTNGKGGEGCVYNVQGNKDLVAKLYHANTSSDKLTLLEKKLAVMIADKDFDPYLNGCLRFAWPQDILYDNGRFVGFTMVKASKTFEFHEIMWASLQSRFSKYNYDRSIAVAFNLAQAVHYCHEKGYLIGDLNIKNFRFDKQCHVIFLDTDSFGVTDKKTGAHYQTCAGHPEFLAPELQGVRLDGPRAKFSKESDYFSLAILIFMLLFEGHHPFNAPKVEKSADYRSSAVDNGTMAAIANGQCPYVRPDCGLELKPDCPEFTMLPSALQQLFRRCFYYDRSTVKSAIWNRPSADEFAKALYAFLQRSKKTCRKDPRHLYLARTRQCPFCAADQRMADLVAQVMANINGNSAQGTTGTKNAASSRTISTTPACTAAAAPPPAPSIGSRAGFFARLIAKLKTFWLAIR